MPLYQLKSRQKCIIEKIPQVSLLQSLGLREGLALLVMARQPFGGPVVVQFGKRSIAIAKELAEQIEVKEVE